MAKIKNPTTPIEDLLDRYLYNPATGVVTSRRTGRPIRNTNGRGYLRAATGGGSVHMRLHRLAWALHHGAWPEGELDHINRDRTDNRIDNLRMLSRADNSRNRKATCRAGYLGVRIAPNGRFYGALTAADGRSRKQTPRRATAFEAAVDVAEAGIFFNGRSAWTYDDAVALEACRRNRFDLELLRLFDFDHPLWRWKR